MDELDGSSFGSVLRFFRRRENLTQQKLAEKLEVHVNSVSLWERELERPETYGVLSHIAKILCRNEEEKRFLVEARYGTASILPLYNVPFERNPYFTGREILLQQLHEQLTTKKQATLKQAISGIGGVGKTQTALEYAYKYRESYHDIFWVDASSFESLTSSYVALAEHLYPPEKDRQDQNLIVAAVKRWLTRHEKWLLILDNVEDFNLVNTFVPPVRQGAALLTTQSQFTEPVAQSIEIDCMKEEEGALFLLRRAHLLSSQALLDEASPNNVTPAKTLSRELGGLPLALDQAGAYIREVGCSLADYLALYTKRRAELLQERGDVPVHHPASVPATFSLAFDRVAQKHVAAPELLRFFAFLAPDNIPEELVLDSGSQLGPILQSLSAEKLEYDKVIKALRAFSLIQRNIQRNAISVHRLVQAVMQDTLKREDKQQWAERVVLAINQVFSGVEHGNWPQCESLLPHALVAAQLIEQEQISRPEAALLLNKVGNYLQDRAGYADAERLLGQARAISEQCLGAGHLSTAKVLHSLANLYRRQEKHEQAESLFVQARAIYECPETYDLPNLVRVFSDLAGLYQQRGNFKLAESLYNRAFAGQVELSGAEHSDTAMMLNNLATNCWYQGKYEQAGSWYQRALDIWERNLGEEHPRTAMGVYNVALLYAQQEKYEEAERWFKRALSTDEKIYGDQHPEVATDLNNLAECYLKQKKHTEAKPLYQRALAIREEFLGAEHSDTAMILNALAELYREQDQDVEAEQHFQRALGILEQSLGPEHPNIAHSLIGLAILYQKQGKYEEAEPLYQRALRIREQRLGPEHPETAETICDLAAFQQMQGNHQEALALYQRALTIREQALGTEHPKTRDTQQHLTTLRQSISLEAGAPAQDNTDAEQSEGNGS